MDTTPKKLFLLDAMALVYRAYFALIRNPRLTSKGRNTNAQFGFTTTLFDLINKEKPTHMAVAFDTEAPTERHTDFTAYKANRQEAPEDLTDALPDIKRIIQGFNIPVVEVDGYEADDVIGTLAWEAEAAGYEVYMVTPDKDYGQLVTDKVFIYKPPYMGNKEEIMGPKEVCEKWDIPSVDKVIDILGLMGDAVDNIPGIKGVGEKTAAKLLKDWGSLENVLANAGEIKGAMGEKIRNGTEDAIMSKKLATIITNVPVEFHEENFRLKEWNKPELTEIFNELEFKTLAKRILGEEGPSETPQAPAAKGRKAAQPTAQGSLFGDETPAGDPPAVEDFSTGGPEDVTLVAERNIHNTPHEYVLVQTPDELDALLTRLQTEPEICFDTETTGTDPNDAELVGMSFAVTAGHGWYIPVPADQDKAKALVARFGPLFQRKDVRWVGQNLKYDLTMLKWYGARLDGDTFDTMLAHYVIEPAENRRSMDYLSTKYLSYEPVHIEELIGKKGKGQGNMRDVAFEKIKDYAAEDADITLQLKQVFIPQLKGKEVEKVFFAVENPLVKVLTDMEFEGIRVDQNFLNDYSKELDREAREAEERVYKHAGVRFNLASPKQLGEVLFEKLQLDPKAKKTRTGQYATGEEVLLRHAGHQIVDDILIYRELTKLKSTYVDALPALVNRKTGRVHTSYNQAVAVTGRLSSNNPNLQNIPVRTDRGKEIRKAFIPRDADHVLVSADYSQIELRIVAAVSGDPAMCEAFRSGKDIHTATAAKVYNKAEEEVTKVERYKAKSVNFGIIYGQGAFGLADNLKISRGEAKEIIDNYKKQFAGIQRYMDDTINFAKEHGYVQTLMGRKRWLPDINSANFSVRGFAERNAINSPIQGTAADMIKLAMIRVHEAFQKAGFRSKMLLQVHDELVFDAPRSEIDIIKPVILECMQGALPLPNDVPVIAEVGYGDNWLEAH
ncbi:MAG TPA: DNA polymerase I [Dinghuibacter sp.]|uniref:DNA polymerase I n=1 Tax=Dinghuibacter sp. TaxID=2024697 RepID=UPI002C6D37D3|nr:DNA polymerase I [Dinghuibacter sp.]HTJ12820.1 DNA polymerase I [Dinghuibacter sp.]